MATEKKNDLPSRAILANDGFRESSSLRERRRDIAGSGFSITVLERDFSNQPIRKGFEKAKRGGTGGETHATA